MLRIEGGARRTSCAGMTRRTVLEAAGAGLLGLTVPGLFRARAAVAGASASAPPARAKSVIFVFLFGGPSQLETFDMKPDAPEVVRGPMRPIACRTPGLLISEGLPRLASISNKFKIVRTMTHPYNDHSGAAHYIQTGRIWHVPIGGGFNPTPRDWPSMGSVVDRMTTTAASDSAARAPVYAVLPNTLGRLQQDGRYLRPGEHAGWLGRRHNPLTTRVDKRDADDNPYFRDCSDEELTFAIEGLGATLETGRMRGRLGLLEQLDAERRRIDRERDVRHVEFDQFRERALALATSPATREALDARAEPDRIRDRYGRHLLGQSLMIARRLVEAGSRFVTVHYDACDGYGWDSHVHSDDVRNHLMPTFDQGLSALLEDLESRGLLDETLVIAMGEMGRTPKGTPTWGRGHWSSLFPALLAGAGISGGTTHGRSDREAGAVLDHPVRPEELAATIYHALGIPHDLRLNDPQGRPTPIVTDAEPIPELLA